MKTMAGTKAVRAACAAMAVGVLVLLNAAPAAAYSYEAIPMQGFMIWPPNYAACGSGFQVTNSGDTNMHGNSGTWSYQHGCGHTPSPANAGAIAAQAQVHKKGSGSSYALCDYSLSELNSQGEYTEDADVFADACGSGHHRAQARWRITYGGTNYPDNDETAYYWMNE